jgi:hypothetical protein
VRKQGVVLEHHANAPRFGRHIQLRTAHQLALEADLAGDTGSSPATARSSVVLPQPEGPISTPMSPARSPA